MASPDPERALEDETPAEPGARAGEPRGGDDEDPRKVTGEAGERAGRASEGRLDPRGVGGRPAGAERLGGEAGAAHGGADALARDVAREAGGVADQREALAADPPRPAAADRVGVPAKGREGEVVGQPPAGGEPRQQALEPPADGLAAQRAHADVQEVALREVPAVALEVGLGDELGPAVARRERAQALGTDARLALLRHDHLLLDPCAPEGARHRTAVPARADDHPGSERAGVARGLDAARDLAHLAHARALVHLDPRRGRAPEEEGVELRTHDAVTRGAFPVGLVLHVADRDRDGRERLDRVRVRRRVELQVGERGGRHPAGAELDAREACGVEDGDARPRPRESPGDRAARWPAPHHEDVGDRHTRSSPASTASRVPSGTRRRSIALAARMAAKMSPSMSTSPPMYASPKRSEVGRRTMRRKAPRERNTRAKPLSPVPPTHAVVPSQRRKVSGASREAKTRRRSPAAAAARRSGGAEGMARPLAHWRGPGKHLSNAPGRALSCAG